MSAGAEELARETRLRPPDARASDFEERASAARFLARWAAERPAAPAVQLARRERGATRLAATSYAELDALATRLAAGFCAAGLARGERAAVFLPPGPLFVAVCYALWRAGAALVLIDPGMGARRLAACLARARPRAFIGLPRAHVLRLSHPRAFRGVELFFASGRGAPGLPGLARLAERAPKDFEPADTRAEELAAVLFTSGATGPPKGALYTHGNLAAQVAALGALFDFRPGEADVACFPPFALFSVALGMSAVFPEMDARRPARCDPALVVAAVEAAGATNTFGSPAVWRRVAPWCAARGATLGSLRRVLISGAPVPVRLFEELLAVVADQADVYSAYGATEALPVASIGGRELLATARARIESGQGTCLGRPAPGVATRILSISDEALARFPDPPEVPEGEPGELCVAGPAVTRAYDGDPEANARAKIAEGERVWHRMGDLCWRGADGRLWFCGRKVHRIETSAGLVLPVPVENVIDARPGVARSALVGVGPRGAARPVLVVEPEGGLPRGRAAREALLLELRQAARKNPRTAVIEELLLHPSLPVDARHNAKIDREALAHWAAERLR